MSKISVKENKSPYQLRREELGKTREEASELLEGVISPNKLEKIENNRITLHPEDVLLMSQKYNAPDLCNYYCASQCPIGQQYVPEVKVKSLAGIVLEMLASLNSVEQYKNRLIEITADGEITEDEIEDFNKIRAELERISIAVEALQLWSEKIITDGKLDIEKIKQENELKLSKNQTH